MSHIKIFQITFNLIKMTKNFNKLNEKYDMGEIINNNIRFENKATYRQTNGEVKHYQTITNTNNNTMSGAELFNRFDDLENMDILKEREKQEHKIDTLLLTQKQIEKLKSELTFIDPNILYKTICKSARVIPEIELLKKELNDNFQIKIIENIYNLKQYSPLFYVNNIKKQNEFIIYQTFIYLISMIIYVSEHSVLEEFVNKDVNMPVLIAWCLARNLPDLVYILRGPTSNTTYNINFKILYKSLISSSNELFESGEDILNDMQLMSLKKNEEYLLDLISGITNRKNAYNKLQNISEAYLIHFDTDHGCVLEQDINGDLVVNCQGVELGNGITKDINLKYDALELDMKTLDVNSKISSAKLAQLLNNYNTIKISNLLINKKLYKTSLDLFEKIYIVFPNIFMISRTNHVYNTGALEISGKFVSENNWYKFIPDNLNGMNYKSTTVHVKKVDFLISDKPGEKSSLSFYTPNISINIKDLYNVPLLNENFKINDTKLINKNSIIFIFYDLNLSQIKKSIFIYNIDRKIIQWINLDYCDDESLNYLSEFTFDIRYIDSVGINYNYDLLNETAEFSENGYNFNQNQFKAYYCDVDLIHDEWNIEDYIYSLNQLLGSNTNYNRKRLYKNLNLRYINDIDENITVNVCYYCKKINNTLPYLTFKYPGSNINTLQLKYNNKKYYIQKLNTYLNTINYQEFIDDRIINFKLNYDIKMMIELC